MRISIEGTIGTGKSKLLRKLRCMGDLNPNKFDFVSDLEQEWRPFNKIFGTLEPMTFEDRIRAMINYSNNHGDREHCIQEGSILSIYYVFSALALTLDKLTLSQFETLGLLLRQLLKTSMPINGIIFLRGNPNLSFERMKGRIGKKDEPIMRRKLTYISRLFDNVFHELEETFSCEVTIIDARLPEEEVYKRTLKAIRRLQHNAAGKGTGGINQPLNLDLKSPEDPENVKWDRNRQQDQLEKEIMDEIMEKLDLEDRLHQVRAPPKQIVTVAGKYVLEDKSKKRTCESCSKDSEGPHRSQRWRQ